jgi:streptomycin 6-kinase
VIDVPAELLAERERQQGEAGRRWVAALPGLVTRLSRELGLEIADEPDRHGANAVVIGVGATGNRACSRSRGTR